MYNEKYESLNELLSKNTGYSFNKLVGVENNRPLNNNEDCGYSFEEIEGINTFISEEDKITLNQILEIVD